MWKKSNMPIFKYKLNWRILNLKNSNDPQQTQKNVALVVLCEAVLGQTRTQWTFGDGACTVVAWACLEATAPSRSRFHWGFGCQRLSGEALWKIFELQNPCLQCPQPSGCGGEDRLCALSRKFGLVPITQLALSGGLYQQTGHHLNGQ